MTNSVSYFNHKQMHKFFEMEFWEALLLAFAAWMGSIFLPIWPFIGLSFFLVCCDHVTGVRAAKKLKQEITADGFYRSIEKVALYFLAILMSKGVQMVFFPGMPDLPVVGKDILTWVVALGICRTEYKSNIQNIETVTGAKLWSAITDKFPTLGGDKK